MVLVAEDYEALNQSQIGIKRGNEIAEQLRARGFDVILKDNPSNATAQAALHDFSAKVSGTDLSLAILIGHGTASGDQTFFLPTNAVIERSTDLRTRALSIANIARIVSQAGVGGVCFLMTSPRFDNPIDGIDMRPHFDVDVAKNIVAAFSNSAKIPVSRIGAVAGSAANEVVDLLQKQPHADLRQLVAACASQQGSVYGSAATVNLAAPVIMANTPGTDELARQLKTEKEAREAAEKQARDADERASQAEAREVQARRQAEAREAEERARQAEAREVEERAKQAEERARQAEAREVEERAKQVEERAREAEAKANTQSSPRATAQAPSAPVDRVAARCDRGKTDLNGRCIATTRRNRPPVIKPAAAPVRAKHSAFKEVAQRSSGVRDPDKHSASADSGWNPFGGGAGHDGGGAGAGGGGSGGGGMR
jgi:hypothetical protein